MRLARALGAGVLLTALTFLVQLWLASLHPLP